MNLKPAVTGDLGDTRTLQLNGIDNLSAATGVVGHVWPASGGTAVELAASVADATACTITLELGDAGDWLATADPATYYVEIEVTFANGDKLTWPTKAPGSLTVRADNDPTP